MVITYKNFDNLENAKEMGIHDANDFIRKFGFKQSIVENKFIDCLDDRESLNISLELCSQLKNISLINDVVQQINPEKMIDMNPLYKAIYYIHNKEEVIEEDSINFFTSYFQLRRLNDIIYKIIDTDKTYFDYEIDFTMLSYPLKEQEKITDDFVDELNEKYFDLTEECKEGKITVSEFINKAKSLMNYYLNQ